MKIDANLTVVVCGGASGLGEAVSRRFADLGAKVTILDNNVQLGKKIALEIKGLFVSADIANYEEVRKAFVSSRKKFGQERVCINCVGIAPAEKTISKGKIHSPELFRKVIDTNLVGAFNVATLSAGGMAEIKLLENEEERGLIINTASIAAYEGQMGQLAYAASKSGIVGMTLPMARDLADKAIRVMAIAPGIFSTPMLHALPKEVKDSLSKSIPFPRRLGNPGEFANLVVHISENPMLNGETIRLDGAIRLSPR
jgi:NAD(P)-dependent dehydrogenase (short-subunit alcohol dehydrogenase family)